VWYKRVQKKYLPVIKWTVLLSFCTSGPFRPSGASGSSGSSGTSGLQVASRPSGPSGQRFKSLYGTHGISSIYCG